jgi:hypothetical protein
VCFGWFSYICWLIVQSDQKVSVQLMSTIQKVTTNVVLGSRPPGQEGH